MHLQLVFTDADYDNLDASADEALAAATSLGTEARLEAVNICDIVHQVLPILTTIKSIACVIPFGPLKKICKAVETVITLLNEACPS